MLTVMADDPRGFGRVVRAADGTVQAIVEEYVATPEQLQIHELNVGAYCFEADWLWDALQAHPEESEEGRVLPDGHRRAGAPRRRSPCRRCCTTT